MAVLKVDDNYLRDILKGVVREVIQDEILKLKLSLLPMVSDKEMEEIDRVAGAPQKYEAEEFETLEL
ncbi:MAG: hypothetical protein GY950_10195 [bacterium]|nr:hypothetical protein [bacterium]